ncbi:MAG: aminotransferase class I/II-fold pyridoxal phosphate-dependent enzyme [Phycisphaeraceae bacterium]|nr:MAG: aminotransferase class I/II-fold pyridoxal phosphate-dependent enzyme [Phycisphaeraceae bacterium]
MNIDALLAGRSRAVEASGIRRIFDLAATLKDPIDLSIGQPDFQPPAPLQEALIEAVKSGRNGYTLSQGVPALREKLFDRLAVDVGWRRTDDLGLMVTSGTLGALTLAYMALLDEGDEIIIPDPYFVAYPHLARLIGAHPVFCDTYPDCRMTAERIEPLITPRTKAVLLNSPGNPSGVTLTQRECAEVLDLCRRRNVLLISDEIYDEFVYDDARDPDSGRCPSPAREPGAEEDVLLVRGFGKSYGCTGWRMGYAAGPKTLINEMTKVQQYTFVCAPSISQWGCLAALDTDITPIVQQYQKRRDMALAKLEGLTEVANPGGAFYLYPRVPERLGLTGQQFVEKAVENSVLVIPANVFSERDTHFRISFAAAEDKLEKGLEILAKLLEGKF